MATFLQYRALRRRIIDRIALPGDSHGVVDECEASTVVDWEGPCDPDNPRNWPKWQKWLATLLVSLLALFVGVCGPILSPILERAAQESDVSTTVESLSVALYLFGLGCGALISGPFSEVFGRSGTYLVTLGLMCVWLLGAALTRHLAGRFIFRFLAGFSGATPLVCSGGTIGDLWSPRQRTYAFSFFAIVGFGTPGLGPVMTSWLGDAVTTQNISWRWADWIALILAGAMFMLLLLLQPETYAPIILSWKAKHKREITGCDRYRAEHEISKVSLQQRLCLACSRPFALAWRQPTIQLASFYLAVIYTVLFTFFDGYPRIFGDNYDLSTTTVYIVLTPITFGSFLSISMVPFVYRKTSKALQMSPHGQGDPAVSLWFSLYAAPGLPISLFWMAWTARPSITIWSPILASIMFGFSATAIFISVSMYLIDTFTAYAASAMAFTYLARYSAASAMTVAGIPWYNQLGSQWTLTILGAISLVLTPLPYIFHRYGTSLKKVDT